MLTAYGEQVVNAYLDNHDPPKVPHPAAGDVAIGDTFNHAGDNGGAWEVTRALSADVWRLDRGPGVAVATSAELLDGRTWVRTRAV